ncbi:hypothetical protein M3Y99_00788000 [Aphelenchoides fujianensis]|nr:hypothetical protein M3Y99_00788000 [Aphelenchoides fujianensis]
MNNEPDDRPARSRRKGAAAWIRPLTLLLLLFLRLDVGGGQSVVISQTVHVLNGTSITLQCAPAEHVVRTHMAPDFESPQLIRRVDWFHDDGAVAVFQQDALIERQWWVAGVRYQLRRPFYELRIAPSLPEDSGQYRCRIEADEFFVQETLSPTIPVLVMVRSTRLTIMWTQAAGAAHRPVLRYSVLINQVDDESLRVIATKGNATTAVIDSLLPYTRYKLSVRAENHAGSSEFGPEGIFRTLGEAPKHPPAIQLLRNGTAGCVDVAWKNPPTDEVHRAGTGAMREWYVKTNRQSLCSLLPAVEYALSIETDNGFGYSPPASTTFRSEDAAPEGPPESIEAKPLSSDAISVMWTEPSVTNGRIVSYQLHYKKLEAKGAATVVRLVINRDSLKTFAYNLTNLEPSTAYEIQLTASTSKGRERQERARPMPAAPQIVNMSYECGSEVRVAWKANSAPVSFFKILLESDGAARTLNTSKHDLLIKNLAVGQKYDLRIFAVLHSRYSNLTLFESAFSKAESFVVNSEKCVLQSSLCSASNENCVAIAAPLDPEQSGQSASSFLIVVICILSFMCTFLLVIWYFKRFEWTVEEGEHASFRRCLWVKKMLKKADKQNGHETISLVYETSECAKATSVHVAQFERHWLEMSKNENAGFRRQFQEIENDAEEIAEEPPPTDAQRLKDRYMNIGAVERTRIRLNQANGSADEGYINANHVDSCDEKRAYIATQAPLPATFSDFYQMVWQEHCNLIVVITNLVERGKRKCDVYWPTCKKTPLIFGQLQIGLTAEMPNANFNKMAPERVVHQVHLTSWPDHGVPNTTFPLLSFINYCADIRTTGPVVVHCSAGTLDQYVFIHSVVRELIRHGITRQSVPHFPNYLTYLYHQVLPDGRSRLQMQYEEVCKCPHSPQCRMPNGFVRLPGYHRSDEFLVGNWTRECAELWKEVWEHKCPSVVLFGSDAEVGDFFRAVPLRTKPEITITAASPNRPVHVSIEKPPPNELIVRRDDAGHILLRKDDEELCVKIVRLTPSELEGETWAQIERIQDQSSRNHRFPLMFVDPSNSAMPFVICALQSIACQLEQERYVDVLLYLAEYRLRCCGCWQAQSNVEYIYAKVLELIHLHCS